MKNDGMIVEVTHDPFFHGLGIHTPTQQKSNVTCITNEHVLCVFVPFYFGI